MPQSAGQRLRRMRGARPRKYLRQQSGDDLVLVLRLPLAGRNCRCRCRARSTGPRPECADRWQRRPPRLRRISRAADTAPDRPESPLPEPAPSPSCARPGMGGCCGPSLGCGSQQESKSTKTGRIWCRDGDGQKCVDALLKALRILLPEQVVQEHAHGVHADALGPAQFAVDGGRIEGVGLPHLQFVDGRRRQKVRAHRPGLAGVPGVGLRLGPALLRAERRDAIDTVASATSTDRRKRVRLRTLTLQNDDCLCFMCSLAMQKNAKEYSTVPCQDLPPWLARQRLRRRGPGARRRSPAGCAPRRRWDRQQPTPGSARWRPRSGRAASVDCPR